jgi:hypothetical protein
MGKGLIWQLRLIWHADGCRKATATTSMPDRTVQTTVPDDTLGFHTQQSVEKCLQLA